MGDNEQENGKQLQIDFLKAQMINIDGKLDKLLDAQASQQISLATYIAGRASTCPNRPEIDKEIKAMCDKFDSKITSIDNKLTEIVNEMHTKANKKDVVSKGEIKLIWVVISSAIVAVSGFLGIVSFWR